jgi:hypothetical protein
MDYYIHVTKVKAIGFKAGIQTTYKCISVLLAGVCWNTDHI